MSSQKGDRDFRKKVDSWDMDDVQLFYYATLFLSAFISPWEVGHQDSARPLVSNGPFCYCRISHLT